MLKVINQMAEVQIRQSFFHRQMSSAEAVAMVVVMK